MLWLGASATSEKGIVVTAKEVIEILGLMPLPGEGGFYRETYRASTHIGDVNISSKTLKNRVAATCIYYLVTPETFSVLHRLPQDEVFHFYSGEPVEMLILIKDKTNEVITLGSDLLKGQIPQFVVPAGSWQGTRLISGAQSYALLGTSVSPGFEFTDMEIKGRKELMSIFPNDVDLIKRYTLED